jgi:Spy/CpxP family protein refolding chaperone
MNRKTHRVRIVLTLLTLSIVAATALAVPRAGHALRPFGLLAELVSRVDLTPAQRTEIRAILGAHRDQVATLVDRERAARAALRESIQQSQVDDAAVRSASAKVAVVDADLAIERASIFAEVSAVLTPEQRVRAREGIEELHESLLGRAMDVYDLGVRLL